MTDLRFLNWYGFTAAPSGPTEGATMQTEHFDSLSNEQQDHLFYVLHDAREAVYERWLMELGTLSPAEVERAIAEQYVAQLNDEAANAPVACATTRHPHHVEAPDCPGVPESGLSSRPGHACVQ
ncbi:hypothetical protein J3D45_002929 [Microbacterium foliorum]|uniref:hypothetical protein n=1 Tax=Microbacterium foliorum TaxID=104336 RepID=UPI00209EA6B7|nr:hypothetical protein [Microbacterium foliorum]MCP1430431.1 hypothetical protein [Microbacterium foliorum]